MKKYFWVAIFFCVALSYGQTRYNHILITNDDGIEDADRLLALAKNVKQVADRVSIIVSTFDRSGTSNHTTFGKHQSVLEITCKYIDKENNIAAYTLPVYPADCVLLGIGGFFGEDRPDLVLSGINGGSNIGPGWFGSGTIGAVRTAAFLGVKAIALSGFDDDLEASYTSIPGWITAFISSGIMDEMDENSYLTVGFPRIPLEEIKGVKLVKRRVAFTNTAGISFNKIHGGDPNVPDSKTIWALEHDGYPSAPTTKLDDYYLHQGYIIITPMTIDENNSTLLHRLQNKQTLIPDFNVVR